MSTLKRIAALSLHAVLMFGLTAANAQSVPVAFDHMKGRPRTFAETIATKPPVDAAQMLKTIKDRQKLVQTATNGSQWPTEAEPNGTPASATPLTLSNGAAMVQANLFPNGDIDYFSFQGNAGDRVYAAVITNLSAGSSTDSQLTLLASDGTTVIEFDDDNGSLAALSSSIAGATLPANGTYYLKVNDFTAGTTSERFYRLYLQVRGGTPQAEVEPNDTAATANALSILPSGATSGVRGGWVSGARNPAVATEQDWFSLQLNAGDTVFLSLDLDPERDGVTWNGRLGLGLFGDASNQVLVIDDAGTGDVAPNPNRPSEAFVFTVKDAGTYYAFVDSASAAVGGPTATYHLNVTVLPRPTTPGSVCTTYTSTNVPQTLGPGTGLSSSTITVPGNPIIDHLSVAIQLNHALMADLDVNLRSPAGNNNGLFNDIGAAATGGQTQMDLVFDDDAAIAPAFTVMKGMRYAPSSFATAGTVSGSGPSNRLGWFKGENAGGTWTLDLRDDTAGANGGTLTGWSLEVCEPPPPPVCPAGYARTTVFATDFESGAAGFAHSGTGDQWALGLPNTPATSTANPIADFTNCASGVNCWKTNLTGPYAASTSQDLLSPAINLAGLVAPVIVNWSHRYQMESPTFDHYFVDFQQVGGATPVRVFEWYDGSMLSAPGNPVVNIPASAGWAKMSARADALAGQNTEIRFHLDSDSSVNFGGVAVDDVSVTACRQLSADLSITKTDGVTTAPPGGSVTYTITASNAGPDAVTGATVADTFPAILTATWTCVGAGGGTCTASGSGNINDSTVNLPVGASVTYTVSAAINPAATGSLSNTATISSSIADPNPGNNSATDTDTLTPQADLAITKTDGVTTAAPGGSVTYTITASNAGPSNAPGATVADTFPASLSGTWTCVGAGGGTCTASGSGNINDTVNLPAGGSVTYTVSANVNVAASGTLSNTATVAAPAGVTDPTPGNNSATDSDTLVAQANLGVTITDSPDPVTSGSNVTYTITATNAGPSNATGAAVSLPLNSNSTFVSFSAPAGVTCTAPAVGSTGTVNCSFTGGFNVSASPVTITVVANVNSAFGGTLSVSASISATTSDPNPANNNATTTTSVNTITYAITGVASPVAGGTVSCTSPVAHGSTTTCTATANAGYVLSTISGCGGVSASTSPYTTGPVTAACNVTGTFVLNTFVVSGAVSAGNGTVTCASPVTLGSTTTCTVTPGSGAYVLSVSGCGGTPGTGLTYTTGPITAACTVTAAFGVLSIPALNGVSLALLVLMLLYTAWFANKRRRA